ncbi:hypothetical protein [Lyngbya aestuarii]
MNRERRIAGIHNATKLPLRQLSLQKSDRTLPTNSLTKQGAGE